MSAGESSKLRLLVDTPWWWCRPSNTDWAYTRSLGALEGWAPVDVTMLHSNADAFAANLQFIIEKLGWRRALAGRARWSAGSADVIFSHRAFPRGSAIPVVWMYSILDPLMMEANGKLSAEITESDRDIVDDFHRAAVVQVCTERAKLRHTLALGLDENKVSSCPFFLPYLQLQSETEITRKHDADLRIQMLFVGHQARRKGLDLLLRALNEIPLLLRKRIDFHVVSSFSDMQRADLIQPEGINIHLHGTLSRAATLSLFRSAHLYAMPSRFESYGLSFVEALAAGCAVLAPHWEAQRDILDDGRAGWLVDPFNDFSAALEDALADRELRKKFALKARDKAARAFVPEVVGHRYWEMLNIAAGVSSF